MSLDELDIYDDLDDFQEKEEKKSKEIREWEIKYKELEQIRDALTAENKTLLKKIKLIEVNFQNLLDTAKAELKRKDTLIAQLRKEKDDICFRRKSAKFDVEPKKSTNNNNWQTPAEHFNSNLQVTAPVSKTCEILSTQSKPVAGAGINCNRKHTEIVSNKTEFHSNNYEKHIREPRKNTESNCQRNMQQKELKTDTEIKRDRGSRESLHDVNKPKRYRSPGLSSRSDHRNLSHEDSSNKRIKHEEHNRDRSRSRDRGRCNERRVDRRDKSVNGRNNSRSRERHTESRRQCSNNESRRTKEYEKTSRLKTQRDDSSYSKHNDDHESRHGTTSRHEKDSEHKPSRVKINKEHETFRIEKKRDHSTAALKNHTNDISMDISNQNNCEIKKQVELAFSENPSPSPTTHITGGNCIELSTPRKVELFDVLFGKTPSTSSTNSTTPKGDFLKNVMNMLVAGSTGSDTEVTPLSERDGTTCSNGLGKQIEGNINIDSYFTANEGTQTNTSACVEIPIMDLEELAHEVKNSSLKSEIEAVDIPDKTETVVETEIPHLESVSSQEDLKNDNHKFNAVNEKEKVCATDQCKGINEEIECKEPKQETLLAEISIAIDCHSEVDEKMNGDENLEICDNTKSIVKNNAILCKEESANSCHQESLKNLSIATQNTSSEKLCVEDGVPKHLQLEEQKQFTDFIVKQYNSKEIAVSNDENANMLNINENDENGLQKSTENIIHDNLRHKVEEKENSSDAAPEELSKICSESEKECESEEGEQIRVAENNKIKIDIVDDNTLLMESTQRNMDVIPETKKVQTPSESLSLDNVGQNDADCRAQLSEISTSDPDVSVKQLPANEQIDECELSATSYKEVNYSCDSFSSDIVEIALKALHSPKKRYTRQTIEETSIFGQQKSLSETVAKRELIEILSQSSPAKLGKITEIESLKNTKHLLSKMDDSSHTNNEECKLSTEIKPNLSLNQHIPPEKQISTHSKSIAVNRTEFELSELCGNPKSETETDSCCLSTIKSSLKMMMQSGISPQLKKFKIPKIKKQTIGEETAMDGSQIEELKANEIIVKAELPKRLLTSRESGNCMEVDVIAFECENGMKLKECSTSDGEGIHKQRVKNRKRKCSSSSSENVVSTKESPKKLAKRLCNEFERNNSKNDSNPDTNDHSTPIKFKSKNKRTSRILDSSDDELDTTELSNMHCNLSSTTEESTMEKFLWDNQHDVSICPKEPTEETKIAFVSPQHDLINMGQNSQSCESLETKNDTHALEHSKSSSLKDPAVLDVNINDKSSSSFQEMETNPKIVSMCTSSEAQAASNISAINVTIDETLVSDANLTNTQNEISTDNLKSNKRSENSSQQSPNTSIGGTVKCVSLGSSDYRFEQLSENVVKLVVRRRRRKNCTQ